MNKLETKKVGRPRKNVYQRPSGDYVLPEDKAGIFLLIINDRVKKLYVSENCNRYAHHLAFKDKEIMPLFRGDAKLEIRPVLYADKSVAELRVIANELINDALTEMYVTE